MNKNLFIVFIPSLLMFISCHSQKKAGQTITVSNPSVLDLNNKCVVIQRRSLKNPAANTFPVLISQTGETLPSQLEDTNGDGQWDQLFFLVDLPAKAKRRFNLQWSDHFTTHTKRTSVRFGVRQNREATVQPAISDTFYPDQLPAVIGYQHYQTDGPTWENDKVGFRLYLDGRNSIDVFGKKTSELTPEDVGIGKDGLTENNYSEMKEWGTDILAVGNSVGIGGVSLLINDSLARLGVTEQDPVGNVDSTIFKIVSEGPVRSIMKFSFLGWKPLDRNYKAEMITSIWPGEHAFKNSVRLNNLRGDETLVVGLVNSKTNHKLTEIIGDNWVVLFTHDKQSVNQDWWLGLALILPRADYLGFMEAPKTGKLSTTYLAKLKIKNNQPVDYYAVAGWELSDTGFQNANYFQNYVVNLAKQLTTEIQVSVN